MSLALAQRFHDHVQACRQCHACIGFNANSMCDVGQRLADAVVDGVGDDRELGDVVLDARTARLNAAFDRPVRREECDGDVTTDGAGKHEAVYASAQRGRRHAAEHRRQFLASGVAMTGPIWHQLIALADADDMAERMRKHRERTPARPRVTHDCECSARHFDGRHTDGCPEYEEERR